jgi:MraZ protein
MLIGEYNYTLDAKGRVSFPSKLRDILGESFYITKGLDGCLFVMSREEYRNLSEQIRKQGMEKSIPLQRFFHSGAKEATADSHGRISIPPHLQAYAGLSKDVVVVGVSTRAEIWDKQRWDVQNSDMTADKLYSSIEGLIF